VISQAAPRGAVTGTDENGGGRARRWADARRVAGTDFAGRVVSRGVITDQGCEFVRGLSEWRVIRSGLAFQLPGSGLNWPICAHFGGLIEVFDGSEELGQTVGQAIE